MFNLIHPKAWNKQQNFKGVSGAKNFFQAKVAAFEDEAKITDEIRAEIEVCLFNWKALIFSQTREWLFFLTLGTIKSTVRFFRKIRVKFQRAPVSACSIFLIKPRMLIWLFRRKREKLKRHVWDVKSSRKNNHCLAVNEKKKTTNQKT